MPKHPAPEVVEVEDEPLPVEVAAPVTAAPTLPPTVPAPVTVATVGVPAIAPGDLDVGKLVADSQGASGWTVMLGALAVVGGGAGFKLWQRLAKDRHEAKMKALEIEQAKADRGDDQHKQCEARAASLAAQVEQLAAKVEALPSGDGVDIDLGGDIEKLNKRLRVLENARKRANAK